MLAWFSFRLRNCKKGKKTRGERSKFLIKENDEIEAQSFLMKKSMRKRKGKTKDKCLFGAFFKEARHLSLKI